MKVTHGQGDPKELTLLEVNARFMTHEKFAALVRQVAKDQVLQQWPFVWRNAETGERTVLSGNHRVKAAIAAGLETIDWTECDEPLPADERTRIQMAHNAIVGEDDPTILRRLYDSIEDVSERIASGLDDQTLALLRKVDVSSLSEANLDFTTVMVTFLPDEHDRAVRALDDARKLAAADERWLARFDQHGRLLDAIEDARHAAHVMNTATAFDVLLDVWDRHREDLKELWLDGEELISKHPVPVTSLFGIAVPAADGQLVAKALRKIVDRGLASDSAGALRVLAAAYLGQEER